AGETHVIGEEVKEWRVVRAAEDDDVRSAPRVGADDDVGEAVAIDVAGGDERAPGEVGIIGEELADQLARPAVVDVDVGSAARARRGDDVRDAVAVNVADGHADAAREVRIVGKEVETDGAGRGVKDDDVGSAAGVGTDGNQVERGAAEG